MACSLLPVFLILTSTACQDPAATIDLPDAKPLGPGPWPATGIKLIYDGDVGPDPCDFTTLSMLHEYHRRGMIDVIGMIGAVPDPYAASTFRTYNRIYGNEIPIGAWSHGSDDVTFDWRARLMYRIAHLVTTHANPNEVIHDRYSTDASEDHREVPGAVEAYRMLLAEAEADSITIYAAGQLFNFPFLLDSPGDRHSPLDGEALLRSKVHEFVFMGGYFPISSDFPLYSFTSGAEYNWWALRQEGVTRQTIERLVKMEKPITYVGFEVGERVRVGAEIVRRLGRDHPTSDAFYQYRATRPAEDEAQVAENPSFDDVALYHIVEGGMGSYFGSVFGRVRIHESGANSWTESGRRERYLTLLPDIEAELAEIITNRVSGEF